MKGTVTEKVHISLNLPIYDVEQNILFCHSIGYIFLNILILYLTAYIYFGLISH